MRKPIVPEIPRFEGDHGIWVAFYIAIGSGIAFAVAVSEDTAGDACGPV